MGLVACAIQLSAATSVPGLGSPLPHLHRDWATGRWAHIGIGRFANRNGVQLDSHGARRHSSQNVPLDTPSRSLHCDALRCDARALRYLGHAHCEDLGGSDRIRSDKIG